jgi:hypothetical protein
MRLVAAWALGEIEDKEALPALRAALKSETDHQARKAELRALVHSGEPTEQLSYLLESKDPEVRKTAIRGIAGQNGLDPWPWPQATAASVPVRSRARSRTGQMKPGARERPATAGPRVTREGSRSLSLNA